LIISAVSLITTLGLTFLSPKVYLSKAVIQGGVVNESLLKKSEVEEMIKFYDFLKPIINELRLKVEVRDLKEAIKVETVKDTDFMVFNIEYKDKDTLLRLSESIINSFLLQANNMYDRRFALAKQRFEELERHIKSVQSDIERTQKLINDISYAQKTTETDTAIKIILLQNTLPNYQSNLISLFNQKDDLQLTMVKAKEFKLVELYVNPKPIKPNKSLDLAISGIISLMLGAFLAFFLEYWKR
jgi:capsular polysaccharide biosynthesis protein